MAVDLLFPVTLTAWQVDAAMQGVRHAHLAENTYLGARNLAGEQDSLVLETLGPLATSTCWQLCSELLALSPIRFLLRISGDMTRWVASMDRLLLEDPTQAAMCLRQRHSHGRRPHFGMHHGYLGTIDSSQASPRAQTGGTLLLSWRRPRDDEEILTFLMDHVIQVTGLTLRRADDIGFLATDEYLHLPLP